MWPGAPAVGYSCWRSLLAAVSSSFPQVRLGQLKALAGMQREQEQAPDGLWPAAGALYWGDSVASLKPWLCEFWCVPCCLPAAVDLLGSKAGQFVSGSRAKLAVVLGPVLCPCLQPLHVDSATAPQCLLYS